MEELQANGVAKIAETKMFGIIRSTAALISLLASMVLIWMLHKTTKRFTSVYHRMLLGMGIGDIIFSLSQAHFNAASPKDLYYTVWNAIGNRYTCSARGFISYIGLITSTFYIASLNLFSLATAKYQKDERYIRKYIEPWLHGVPIGWSMVYSIFGLVEGSFNDGGGGNCIAPKYNPPHCKGYAKGEIREGFTIPCGRGANGNFYRIALYVQFLIVPIVSIIALSLIYFTVKKGERAMLRYSGNTSSRRQSNSRKVMEKALAFTLAYLVTFVPFLVGMGYGWAGGGRAAWPEALKYLTAIFTPLQGFFNLVVYMQPKVSHVKSRDNISWLKALKVAFSAALNGGRGSAELSRMSSVGSASRGSSKWSSVKSVIAVRASLTRKNSSAVERTSQTESAPAESKQDHTVTREMSTRVIPFALEEKVTDDSQPKDSTTHHNDGQADEKEEEVLRDS